MGNTQEMLDNAKATRRKLVEGYTLQVLTKMLEHDVDMFSTHYINSRTTQIVEETLKKLTYSNEAILKARRAFLDVLIDGAKAHKFTIEDELAEAQKQSKSKDKEEKRIAVERLRKIDRFKSNMPKGATEQRDVECEPVCQFIADIILDKAHLLADEEFINKAIQQDDQLLLAINADIGMAELFEQLYNSIDESYKRANEIRWGKRRDQIKMKDIDKTLKNDKPQN